MKLLRDWMKRNNRTHQWLADELGISRAAVTQWTRVPDDRTDAVYVATGIPPKLLRPDIAMRYQ